MSNNEKKLTTAQRAIVDLIGPGEAPRIRQSLCTTLQHSIHFYLSNNHSTPAPATLRAWLDVVGVIESLGGSGGNGNV